MCARCSLRCCCCRSRHAREVGPKLQDPEAICACLQLLTTAWDSNAASRERLCSRSLPRSWRRLCWDLLGTQQKYNSSSSNIRTENSSDITDDSSAASAVCAAGDLVYAASISATTRPAIVQQLVAKRQGGPSLLQAGRALGSVLPGWSWRCSAVGMTRS